MSGAGLRPVTTGRWPMARPPEEHGVRPVPSAGLPFTGILIAAARGEDGRLTNRQDRSDHRCVDKPDAAL